MIDAVLAILFVCLGAAGLASLLQRKRRRMIERIRRRPRSESTGAK